MIHIQAIPNSNFYLDYLDKKMTIMGILSTFCVAIVAVVAGRVGGADLTLSTLFATLLRAERWHVIAGSVSVSLGAALFYKQRSTLAWYYGQISLSVECPATSGVSVEQWYREADSWATWIPYQCGHTCLVIGCGLYLYSLLAIAPLPIQYPRLLWAAIGVGVSLQAVRMLILSHYRYDDEPMSKFFAQARGR